MDILPWEGIDTFLNNLPISSVKVVHFKNRMAHTISNEEIRLRDHLPGLVLKGELQYRDTPEDQTESFPWREPLSDSFLRKLK